MSDAIKLAQIAALVGDPARANMLVYLLGGSAQTASELAHAARVTPQTASEHLGKLVEGGILAPASQQGRHRYYRLASTQVAAMLESIMVVSGEGAPGPRLSTWRGSQALRDARMCYDHLAGRLGVSIADAMRERGHLFLDYDGAEVTPKGVVFLDRLGALSAPASARAFCRPCLDWSERRPHLAGRIGAALACRCFDLGWITKQAGNRTLFVTDRGHAGFAENFGLEFPGSQAAQTRAA